MFTAFSLNKSLFATTGRLLLVLLTSFSLLAQDRVFSCPAYGGGYLPISWSPTYSAYIPFDHISGATPCYYSGFPQGPVTKIYKGDGLADIGDGWPIQSARTYQDFFFHGSFQNSAQPYTPPYQSGLVNSVGQTRNYGAFSPVNGSILSSADEDNVPNDCYLWNQADYADMSMMFGDLTITGPTGESGNAHFDGTASNPLENSTAKIAWDMRVTMDGSDPNNARVTTVDYNHTCFPAHVVKVQEWTVYHYEPPSSDTTYVFGCLVLQQGKIIGQSQPNEQVPCM